MRPALFITLFLAVTAPMPAAAQVSGAIVIGGFPLAGIIAIGPVHHVRTYLPTPRIVVVERYRAPRVIVVERWDRGRHYGHVSRGKARGVIWYDGHRRGLVEVEVRERR